MQISLKIWIKLQLLGTNSLWIRIQKSNEHESNKDSDPNNKK